MSTYSQSLRVELITPGTEANTWGTITNNNFAYVFDRAIAGYETVSVTSADQALTTFNGPTATGSANQSVYAILRFTTTTTAAFTVYAPPVSKQYVIWNDTAYPATVYNWLSLGPPITTPPGAQSVVIAPGDKVMIFTDGTSFYSVEAGNVTGTVAIANGGTGQTTQQAAINALAGAVTSGQYLRGNGTNVSMSAIQVADVPTLNQNTTGTASNVTGTVAIANGGTGQTTQQAALNALVGTQTANRVLRSDGTNSTLAQVALTTDVSGTLPTANGGTGLSSFTSGRVFYASSSSAVAQSANLTFDGSKLDVSGVDVGLGGGLVATNTVVGNNGLLANTTGAENTSMGYAALANNTTGGYQTAVGSLAANLMTGGQNTAIGAGAMYGGAAPASCTGFQNVALGYRAVYQLTSGAYNTGIGISSLYSLSTGNANVAMGVNAAYSSTTGSDNTALGPSALYHNTTSSGSVAVGRSSLFFMRGGSNVGVGYEVMQGSGTPANNTGYYNVAVGYRALYSISSAHTNLAVGHLAGFDITTGTKNTILGSYSGNQGGLDIRTASNYIVLSDGDGNPRAYWNAANATFNGGLELVGGRLITGIASISSAATITPTADSGNQYCINALATNATINAPSGTPGDGQKLLLRIKDNGVSRTLSWSASYRVIGTTLPSTTTASKITYVGCVYNAPDGVWDVVAVTTQA